ncbi:hypothetical protein FVEG_11611 [Fusarium verticillioides 7600]|uniref:Uncharacterized protein n=1 Tax=Gibberella moniliformis (strain M3125 / FGSC 7600) TaxID=334819 RepID=W7MZ88_GIBM7|nr:hypothetical protein FVEG_11611 [Fusarium verticillioides 7600]EWG53124.1 hypothetical protein FVEG_11611 [Fusarium verticillioides 7600]
MATKSSRRTYTLPAGLKTVAISAENHKSTGHSKWHQGERNTKVEKENKVAKAHVQAKASGRDKSSTGEAKESDEDPDFVTPKVYVQYLKNFFLFRDSEASEDSITFQLSDVNFSGERISFTFRDDEEGDEGDKGGNDNSTQIG